MAESHALPSKLRAAPVSLAKYYWVPTSIVMLRETALWLYGRGHVQSGIVECLPGSCTHASMASWLDCAGSQQPCFRMKAATGNWSYPQIKTGSDARH